MPVPDFQTLMLPLLKLAGDIGLWQYLFAASVLCRSQIPAFGVQHGLVRLDEWAPQLKSAISARARSPSTGRQPDSLATQSGWSIAQTSRVQLVFRAALSIAVFQSAETG